MSTLRPRARRTTFCRRFAGGALALAAALSTAASCPTTRVTSLGAPLGVAPLLFTMPDRPACTADAYNDVADVAVVADAALHEVSGLATSVRNNGVLWGIADTGNEPVVVALSATTGATLVTVSLPVENVDFEDVQTGPCPDLRSACVYVADTGDNDGNRDRAFLYAFPEPVLDDGASGGTVTLTNVIAVPITYDGGAVDVEAVAVSPDGGTFLFFQKTTTEVSARVYALRAPFNVGLAGEGAVDVDDNVLVVAGSVTAPAEDAADRAITSATFHWSGQRLALRFNAGVAEYEGDDINDFFSPATARVIFPINNEGDRGESIAYSSDGLDLFTIAEAAADEVPVLHRSGCP